MPVIFETPTPLPQPVETLAGRRHLRIGLPASACPGERRTPLTPEGVRTLALRGFDVVAQSGIGLPIGYTDEAYANAGAAMGTRSQALACDVVVHLAPLSPADLRQLRRGAILLSLANFTRPQAPEAIAQLLDRRVINIALDLVRDERGSRPFADVMAEIAGRAALAVASSLMIDAAAGKGLLLGGVSGVAPCEVVILGSDLAASAAARSATGLGATVRLFDSDVYRLRGALRLMPSGIIASTPHPHVLEGALRSADVVVSTLVKPSVVVDRDMVQLLKRRALLFDLSPEPGQAFPSLAQAESGTPQAREMLAGGQRRVVLTNLGNAAPRTSAMALSDTLLTLLGEIAGRGGGDASALLRLTPGLQRGVLTFLGRAVHPRAAALAGVRPTDIRILLSLS